MVDNLPNIIKTVLVEELDLSIDPSEIRDDEPLFSSTIRLDSLGMLRVVIALENKLKIRIDDEDMMKTELETVLSLIDLVRTKARDI